MSVITYTKTGTKSTTKTVLNNSIFDVKPKNHELLKQAYLSYLGSSRLNLAVTKKRGEVRGGGKKPWAQKGTGRARFGSSRNPIWRGGGITFGPTGNENYINKLNTKSRRTALRQALSLSVVSGQLVLIDDFIISDNKTSTAVQLLNKLNANRAVLLVVDKKTPSIIRATNNIGYVKLISAKYLNVYDVLNASSIVITLKALDVINEWLLESAREK